MSSFHRSVLALALLATAVFGVWRTAEQLADEAPAFEQCDFAAEAEVRPCVFVAWDGDRVKPADLPPSNGPKARPADLPPDIEAAALKKAAADEAANPLQAQLKRVEAALKRTAEARTRSEEMLRTPKLPPDLKRSIEATLRELAGIDAELRPLLQELLKKLKPQPQK